MSPQLSSPRTLIDWSAHEIARGVAEGELRASDIVEAHIRHIERVDRSINAVVVRLFDEARAAAEQVDAARAARLPLGPLAGVPITIKECFDVRGTASSIGLPRLASDLARDDGPLVARLRQAGAIILGKTNVPQLMLAHETDNPVYGRTNNPWDVERTPGGSSGGEAAVIAAHGSPLGLASDMGGSIRQPAHSCGIMGLKPTSLRLTNVGTRSTFRGMEALVVQPGPLARTVKDLDLAMRILAAPGLGQFDARIAPAPLGDASQVRIEGLRVAVWTDDGYFPSSSSVRRVVDEAAAALRAAGAIVEEFQPPRVAEAVELYFQILSADGGADPRRLLNGDRANAQVAELLRLARVPRAVRPALAWMLECFGQAWLARLVRTTGAVSADAYWQMTYRVRQLAEQFLREFYARQFDAAICPPHALPALRHGSFRELPQASSYCVLPNLLCTPAGVVAAGRVEASEEECRASSRDRVLAAARRVDQGSAGLPVGVQVIARPWREDVVLAVMYRLEEHFREQPGFPRLPPAIAAPRND